MGDSLTVFDCRLNAYTTADDRPIFAPLNSTPPILGFPQGTYFVTAPGGYRGYLAQLIRNDATMPPTTFVGSQFTCGAHEGYAGETVEWLAEHVVPTNVPRYQPDVILFMAGTNDFFWPPPRGSRSPAAVAERLRGLLNETFRAAPKVSFLLSTVTPINEPRCKTYHTARWHPGDCPSDMQGNIDAYNAMLPNVEAEYRARGFDVSLHDVNADARFETSDFWIWGIHFNTTGFQKMAASWHKALNASAPMRRARAHARRAVPVAA